LSLERFQRDFSHLLLKKTAEAQSLGVVNSGKLGVYKNNYFLSVHDHILGVFPIVQRFVGPDFLKSVARDFASAYPPQMPVMHEYGKYFPEFLRAHEALNEMKYVGDLAQVEWSIHALQFSEGVETKGLNPVMDVINSDFPLIRLWMVGQGQLPPESVHVDEGGDTLAIVRVRGEILIQPLSNDESVAVGQLLDGMTVHELSKTTVLSLRSKGVIL